MAATKGLLGRDVEREVCEDGVGDEGGADGRFDFLLLLFDASLLRDPLNLYNKKIGRRVIETIATCHFN